MRHRRPGNILDGSRSYSIISSRDYFVDYLVLDLAGFFGVLPLSWPLVIDDYLEPSGGSTHTIFLTGSVIMLPTSFTTCSSVSSGFTTNVRHTFTGNLQMMTDPCLVPRLSPRNNHSPLPSRVSGLLSNMFSFVRFPPSGHGLPACGEVKLIRGRNTTKLQLYAEKSMRLAGRLGRVLWLVC
ncbi:hypothetical protein CC86DRAFT_374754 [Ophiobolus disseminans]|uniref:Uncharacterized protein n=1 Tax=Ophiobolus disseminans TaxID=1469910 RepID=A0A6A6ZH75_9PLEO|nr:hypothetical protein CC86DRAFT_374754 [Ophiobolus disseminans]